jgi:hypothetical protein
MSDLSKVADQNHDLFAMSTENTMPGSYPQAADDAVISSSPTTGLMPSTTDLAHEAIPDLSTTHPKHWKYISEGGATIVFSYRGPPHPVFSNSVVRLRKCVRAAPALEDVKEVGVGNSEVVADEGTILKPLEIAEVAEQRVRERGSNDSLRSAHSARSLLLKGSSTTLKFPPPPELGSDADSESDWEDLDGGAAKVEVGVDEQPDDPTIAFQTRVTSRLVPLCYLPRLETARGGQRWIAELARIGESSRPEARRKVDGIDLAKRKGVLADDLVGWEGWAVEIKVCVSGGPWYGR